jgi:predicted ATPase
MFAELCLDCHHPAEGLRALATVEVTHRNAFYAPEVYRLEGELMLIDAERSAAAAEERLRTALDLSRARAEKSLELRAAMSLARLWRAQGKSQEAHQLLGEIYSFFTEGFETRDLVSAKALMSELTNT